MKKTKQEWVQFSKQTKNSIIFYKNYALNIKKLFLTHPGGEQAIRNYLGKDVTKIFFNVYRHPKKCETKLLKYKVGQVIEEKPNNQEKNQQNQIDQTDAGKQTKKVKKVDFYDAKLNWSREKMDISRSKGKQNENQKKQSKYKPPQSKSKNIPINKQKREKNQVSIVFSDESLSNKQIKEEQQKHLLNVQNKQKQKFVYGLMKKKSQSQFQGEIIDQQKPSICLRGTILMKNVFSTLSN